MDGPVAEATYRDRETMSNEPIRDQSYESLWGLLTLVVLAVTYVIGMSVGERVQMGVQRTYMVKAGLAEWVSGADGKPEFRFKKP